MCEKKHNLMGSWCKTKQRLSTYQIQKKFAQLHWQENSKCYWNVFFFIYSILHSFDNFFIVKRNIPVKIPKILLYGHTSKTLALNCHHSPHHPPPGPIRFPHTAARTQPSVKRATRDDQTSRPSSASNIRTHRRAPQSSSGPRQPERPVAGMSLLDRRRQRHTKPQSDQRNRNTPKLSKKKHKSLSDKEI